MLFSNACILEEAILQVNSIPSLPSRRVKLAEETNDREYVSGWTFCDDDDGRPCYWTRSAGSLVNVILQYSRRGKWTSETLLYNSRITKTYTPGDNPGVED